MQVAIRGVFVLTREESVNNVTVSVPHRQTTAKNKKPAAVLASYLTPADVTKALLHTAYACTNYHSKISTATSILDSLLVDAVQTSIQTLKPRVSGYLNLWSKPYPGPGFSGVLQSTANLSETFKRKSARTSSSAIQCLFLADNAAGWKQCAPWAGAMPSWHTWRDRHHTSHAC